MAYRLQATNEESQGRNSQQKLSRHRAKLLTGLVPALLHWLVYTAQAFAHEQSRVQFYLPIIQTEHPAVVCGEAVLPEITTQSSVKVVQHGLFPPLNAGAIQTQLIRHPNILISPNSTSERTNASKLADLERWMPYWNQFCFFRASLQCDFL